MKPNVYIYNALIKAQASTGDLIEVNVLMSNPLEHICSHIWPASILDLLLLALLCKVKALMKFLPQVEGVIHHVL